MKRGAEHQQSLDLFQEIFGTNNHNIPVAYYNTATSLYAAHHYEKAEEYYKKGLEINLQNNNGPKSAAQNYTGLCMIYSHDKDLSQPSIFDQAANYCQQSIDLSEKHLQQDPLQIAANYDNMAKIWEGKDNQKAIGYYQEFLTAIKKIQPSPNPILASRLNKIASLYLKNQQYDKAIAELKKADEINKQTDNKPYHESDDSDNYYPFLINYNLCLAYGMKDEFQTAIEYCQKAIPQIPSPNEITSSEEIADYAKFNISMLSDQLRELNKNHQKALSIKYPFGGEIHQIYVISYLIPTNQISDHTSTTIPEIIFSAQMSDNCNEPSDHTNSHPTEDGNLSLGDDIILAKVIGSENDNFEIRWFRAEELPRVSEHPDYKTKGPIDRYRSEWIFVQSNQNVKPIKSCKNNLYLPLTLPSSFIFGVQGTALAPRKVTIYKNGELLAAKSFYLQQ